MNEAWTDHALKALRAACHAADGPSLLALLRTHDPVDSPALVAGWRRGGR
ncbi:hypothetical protein [Streptomyces sp. DSM 40750]|nr:hypothetical protein [Streptomyces sp. DSM 40750]UUU22190.1 hypothetical protein JIX55_18785 [Streptomyces sp. DSM 40750]